MFDLKITGGKIGDGTGADTKVPGDGAEHLEGAARASVRCGPAFRHGSTKNTYSRAGRDRADQLQG